MKFGMVLTPSVICSTRMKCSPSALKTSGEHVRRPNLKAKCGGGDYYGTVA